VFTSDTHIQVADFTPNLLLYVIHAFPQVGPDIRSDILVLKQGRVPSLRPALLSAVTTAGQYSPTRAGASARMLAVSSAWIHRLP
jgi:hypothetical protein